MELKKCEKQDVIPVFYKIEPTNVRHQSGSYQHAFANHEGDVRVAKWKSALEEAGNLAGFAWKNSETSSTEAEFIKNIVGDILEKVKPKYPSELKGLVGIERSYAKIESLLEIGSSEGIRVIGIWGMGGIGKTTLATALYAKLSSSFDGRCFLKNVREGSSQSGLDALRDKLYSELLKEENLKPNSPELVSGLVENRLSRKKVFIVLDDVDTLDQLESLIKDYKCLGSGSRVIVTSRNQHVFSTHKIFVVEQLNHDDSLQPFCVNAFKEKNPKHGYEELSECVTAYCKGIPLALKILGRHLHGKSKEVWKSDLKKLKLIPHMEIQKVLRLSYDGLDCVQQAIFLDIAFFFKGEDKERVINKLEACAFFAVGGIQHLVEMALITISNNKVQMHDLIQEMAWEIVRQGSMNDPGKRTRLCNPEEVCEVLEYETGTEAIEGIRLDVSKIRSLHVNFGSFTKMINLRYIDFYNGKLNDVYNVYALPSSPWSFSRKLRMLRWPRYCLKSLPSTFCAKMLVELDIRDSNLEKLWDGLLSFDNLKTINLSGSRDLVEVPDLSMAPHLDAIDLSGCGSLREVHPSILSLPKLKRLYLLGCRQIKSLKTNVHSKSLMELLLDGCSSLHEFSVSSEEMGLLSLRDTAIHELPSSLLRNRKLSQLYLDDCGNLSIVGKNVVGNVWMESLHELYLSGCKQVNTSMLGFILGGAWSLTSLDIINCYNIRALPDIIKNLSKLKNLKIDGCIKLEYVPELPPSLEWFSAKNCISLKTVSNLSSDEIVDDLKRLKMLDLSNCCNLKILPHRIGLLSSTFQLDISGTDIELLDLSNLPPYLTYLPANYCKSLKIVSNFDATRVCCLRILSFSYCCNLEALPHTFKNLLHLVELNLDECWKLKGLPELPESLQYLRAVNCTSLDRNSTQQQLVQHGRWPKWDYFVLVAGDHVLDCFIRARRSSVTIPHLSYSLLHGFICCIVLSKSFSKIKSAWVRCRITQDGHVVLYHQWHVSTDKSFISDHLVLLFVGKEKLRFKSDENISFNFETYDLESEGIKECGVFPLYARKFLSESEWVWVWEWESSESVLPWESELPSEWELPSESELYLHLKLESESGGRTKDIAELE